MRNGWTSDQVRQAWHSKPLFQGDASDLCDPFLHFKFSQDNLLSISLNKLFKPHSSADNDKWCEVQVNYQRWHKGCHKPWRSNSCEIGQRPHKCLAKSWNYNYNPSVHVWTPSILIKDVALEQVKPCVPHLSHSSSLAWRLACENSYHR